MGSYPGPHPGDVPPAIHGASPLRSCNLAMEKNSGLHPWCQPRSGWIFHCNHHSGTIRVNHRPGQRAIANLVDVISARMNRASLSLRNAGPVETYGEIPSHGLQKPTWQQGKPGKWNRAGHHLDTKWAGPLRCGSVKTQGNKRNSYDKPLLLPTICCNHPVNHNLSSLSSIINQLMGTLNQLMFTSNKLMARSNHRANKVIVSNVFCWESI